MHWVVPYFNIHYQSWMLVVVHTNTAEHSVRARVFTFCASFQFWTVGCGCALMCIFWVKVRNIIQFNNFFISIRFVVCFFNRLCMSLACPTLVSLHDGFASVSPLKKILVTSLHLLNRQWWMCALARHFEWITLTRCLNTKTIPFD